MTNSSQKRGPNRFKLYFAATLAVLVIVIVVQNTAQVPLKALFFDTTMPLAVALFVALVAGFVLGLLTASRRRRKP
jgi:uncharacterized integral membrane protein